MKKLLSFVINNETEIVIRSKDANDIEDIYAYSGALYIVLNYKGQSICLANKITLFDLEQTVLENFKKALNKELPFPSKIHDLGIELNNYWFKCSLDLNESNTQKRTTEPFELFECNETEFEGTNTFLYNNKGHIWLQISTKYLYFFSLEEPPLSYNEWRPYYKILYKQKISHNIMQKWIFQLEEFTLKLRAQT